MQTVSPRQAAIWIADKRAAIEDPAFLALYLEYDAAFDWSADDPRLPALADRSQQWFANHPRVERRSDPAPDPTIARLFATTFAGTSPAWERLSDLAKQRRTGG